MLASQKNKGIKLTAKTVDGDPAGYINVGSLDERSNQPKYYEPEMPKSVHLNGKTT